MSQEKNTLKNRPIIPRKQRHLALSDLTTGIRAAGLDPSVIEKRAKRLVEQKQKQWAEAQAAEAEAGEGMDVDMDDEEPVATRGKDSRGSVEGRMVNRTPGRNRQFVGMASKVVRDLNPHTLSVTDTNNSNPKRLSSSESLHSGCRTGSQRLPSPIATCRSQSQRFVSHRFQTRF